MSDKPGRTIHISDPAGVRRVIEAVQAAVNGAANAAPRQRRKRKPTLSAALKQASKAGKPVSGATLAVDGSVSLTFGEADAAKPNGNTNPWDEVLVNAANQKRPS